ncbi:MAG: hypothetical protein OEW48_12015 [Phycisphaerae bacterium]|nr:hypothetical protein [Phycisphaerae bacterium]
MKKGLEKTLSAVVSGVLLFAALFNSKATANTREPRIKAKQIITKFLSSVELGKDVYDFDHDKDGAVDMYIYPLITTNPDLETNYITLEEASKKREIILKEDPRVIPNGNNPQGSYPILTRYSGSGYGATFTQYPSFGYGPSYYPRGGMLGGGWQNRGFGSGGILGGYGPGGYGPGGYRGYPGYRGYGGYGFKEEDFEENDFRKIAAFAMEDFSFENIKAKHLSLDSSNNNIETKVDALCFEKWRLIEESRFRGQPIRFSYVGMASPFIRKELISFPNQINIHIAIEKELRKLGVYSSTMAFADVFKNKNIKEVINYYITNSKKVFENKDIAGMIITDRNKILCADVYSSPDLFKKMYSQLMQSSALGVLQKDRRSRTHPQEADVKEFLYNLKNVENLKKETSQTYKLFYRKIISGAELYSDKNGTRVVHLEAYPR